MTNIPEGVPPFRILLPAGWEEVPADRSGVDLLIRRASEKLRANHRPDLDAELRTLLEVAYRRMVRGRAFALYLQTAAAGDGVPLPMSITASLLSDGFGGTLDREVAVLFRDRGAQFLRDDRTIVRWETPAKVKTGTDAGTAHVVDYLVPIPGSGRRTAVQLTTVIPVPDPGDETAAIVSALVELSDLMVSTFTWKPADA